MIGLHKAPDEVLRSLPTLSIPNGRGNNHLRGVAWERAFMEGVSSRLDISSWLAMVLGWPIPTRVLVSHQNERKDKMDFAVRMDAEGRARCARISLKTRMTWIRGMAMANQVERLSPRSAMRKRHIPDSGGGALAAKEWLSGADVSEHYGISELTDWLAQSWEGVILNTFFGTGPHAADLVLCLRTTDDGSPSGLLAATPKGILKAATLAGEPSFLSDKTFGNPLFSLRRKGGDSGKKGAGDLQAVFDMHTLFDLLI